MGVKPILYIVLGIMWPPHTWWGCEAWQEAWGGRFLKSPSHPPLPFALNTSLGEGATRLTVQATQAAKQEL